MSTEQNKSDLQKKYTKKAADVIADEREYLSLSEEDRGSGLAFSGGGIRSASFGLGVMQALVGDNKLEKIDYMSTVSGGGYVGSALTWALNQAKGTAGTTSNDFPLGKKGEFARHTQKDANDNVDNKNNFLDFMRQHSSYLMPTRDLGVFSFGGVVLRSMLLSILFYCLLLMTVLTPLRAFHMFTIEISPCLERSLLYFPHGLFIPLGVLLVVIFLILSLAYSVRSFSNASAGKGSKYKSFVQGQIDIGNLWKFALALFLIGLLPYVVAIFPNVKQAFATASASSVLGTLVGLWQYKKAQKNDQSKGPLSDLVIYLGAFALIYGLLIVAYTLSGKIFFEDIAITEIFKKYQAIDCWWAVIACVILTFILGFFVNLNHVGPHRIWRNRLMEAFMPNKLAVEKNIWQPATEADGQMMQDMCVTNKKPYHIINTNIILSHSAQVKYSGRGGDNFIISPIFTGCDATGWQPTAEFNAAGGGITLATAMATSAAALNPNAAVSGEGVTRNTIVSILLSMLNLRLGCWTANPDPARKCTNLPPNFFIPGLKNEILRLGFKETDPRILLSDGGHFENLAIYELIRRKLPLIILSDGGADPAFNFDDLANAVEKVRVDFGAKIIFREKQGLDNLLPGTKVTTEFDKKFSIGQRGFAIADVYYNNDTKGTLVYIKLAMIEGLPTDIYSYKGLNPAFPHQPTSDQFFDEKQFEAYRELGYQITRGMLSSPEGKELKF
jgi:hypothetical protein